MLAWGVPCGNDCMHILTRWVFTVSLSYPRIISEVCPGDASVNLRLVVLLANPSLDRWPFSNSIDPLQQMWKLVHVLLLKAGPLPSFDPWPAIQLALNL